MEVTQKQIALLKQVYEENKENLSNVKSIIRDYGITAEGLADATESFEQGYNNALEYVFTVLGIKN